MLQKREDRQRKRHIRKGGEAKKVHCLEGSLSNPLGAQQRGIEIGDFDSPLNKNLNAKIFETSVFTFYLTGRVLC